MKITCRKLVAMLVIFASVFAFGGVFGATAFAGSFPDVPEDHDNYKAIQYLKDRGYIGGYSDLTFKPENEINRAEATRIIVSALNIPQDAEAVVLFGDVPKDQWFFPYVMGAYKAGIVSGDDNGKFRPGDTINLAESLRIVSEALKVELPGVGGEAAGGETAGGEAVVAETIFADVPSDVWYAKYALYAREKNIVLMDDYGQVHAGDPMTRARFAEIMYRFLIVKDSGGEGFPIEETWQLYESGKLPFKVKYPDNWEILNSGDGLNETVFWKNDKGYYQFSPERIYPNTAKAVVSLDENEEGLSKSEYFSNVKMVFGTGEASEFKLGDFDALQILYKDEYIKDWYIYLGTGAGAGVNAGEVLAVYTQNGPGVMAYQNRKFLDTMLKTFEYKEGAGGAGDDAGSDGAGDGGSSALKSQIFENILLEGAGQTTFGLISDEYIIETDSIGVGTGPIDYYYSSSLDITLKYERAGDVILDYRDGQTTAF